MELVTTGWMASITVDVLVGLFVSNILEKYSNIIFSTIWSSSCHSLVSSVRPWMVFLCLQFEAFWWKKDVLQSPSVIHMCFARWCHIVFLASSQELSDLRTLCIYLKLCCGLCWRTCSSFSNQVICLPMWPNSVLFQWAKHALQLLRQLVIGTPTVLHKPSLQAS